MERRSWEILIGGALLAVCLLAGLALGAWLAPKPEIGLMRFQGAIDLDTADQFITALEEARSDDTIAAVVLEVASPGGLATSSESIYYSLLQLRQEKPVIVVVDGIAVSGGYYIASAANRIFSPASSYVGNVGTRGQEPTDPSLAADEMSSGPYKLSGGSRFDRVHQLERVKEAFVDSVVFQRSQSEFNPIQIDAETLAEARIYLGSEAVALGLVDAEGARTDAIMAAADMANLRNYSVVNLIEQSDGANGPDINDYHAAVQKMVEQAPPDAVFLLDSRIPLRGLRDSGDVERHLLHLRDISPATLTSVPLSSSSSSQKSELETMETQPESNGATGEGS